ncbi:MAG TPA: glycosyltransferase family 87 protein, partial [Bacteroidia bacterium]|nr:glycosyltransferase family 87 protein [Bacteroidia bacterium]
MEQIGDISLKLKSKVALSIFGLFTIVYVIATGWWQSDFFIYISASKDLFLGKDIYIQTYGDGYHYYYSVLFAILIFPLSFLPIVAAQYIWLFFNAILMWRIVMILGRYFKLSALPIKEQWIFFVLCCLFSAKLTLANIYCHQVTILILFLTLEGLECILLSKKIKGAFLIALGINIKLLPVVLIPYLLYRKEFRAVLFIIVAYVLMLVLPLLIIGINRNNFLLGQWWSLINPANNEHVLDVSQRGFHSLTTLLSTLLVDVPLERYDLQVKRNIANLSIAQLSYVINMVRFT